MAVHQLLAIATLVSIKHVHAFRFDFISLLHKNVFIFSIRHVGFNLSECIKSRFDLVLVRSYLIDLKNSIKQYTIQPDDLT
uniref:Putative secreted protein n=1 Tax=Xenopsylla cheopis TaxID=163159 RepID=A0A6M2DWU8_XENCH